MEPDNKISNAKDLSIKLFPKWLTADIFEALLQQQVEDFEKVLSFTANPALNPGENYATNILRVTMEITLKNYSQKVVSYMLKLPHNFPGVQQMLKFVNLFHIERDVLRDVLPELEQMYREVGVHIKIGPTAHIFPTVPHGNYVLMDDLGPLGWRNATRADCLDIAHAELVLRKLAQYHASSAVHVAVKSRFAEHLMKSFNSSADAQMSSGMVMSLEPVFMEHLKTFKDGEKYEAAFENFFKNPSNYGAQLGSDQFNVLCHGDCWSNNFLFKYDVNGEVEDVTFVDFQLPRWGSPVYDLLYFIISSVRIDIKLIKFDYFIRFYYDNLIENLKLLKYPEPLPQLKELFIEMFKQGNFAVMIAVMIVPVVLFDSSKSDFSNFFSSKKAAQDFHRKMYENKRYHTYINELMPWLYNRGWLTEVQPLKSF